MVFLPCPAQRQTEAAPVRGQSGPVTFVKPPGTLAPLSPLQSCVSPQSQGPSQSRLKEQPCKAKRDGVGGKPPLVRRSLPLLITAGSWGLAFKGRQCSVLPSLSSPSTPASPLGPFLPVLGHEARKGALQKIQAPPSSSYPLPLLQTWTSTDVLC